MIEAELAYAAGIVDILGSLRVRTTPTGTELPSVTISTTNVNLLRWLTEKCGTRSFTVTRAYNRVRCAEHCDEAHEHIESITSRWNVTGVRATVLLHGIEPYMHIQKGEAQQLINVGLNATFKPATITKMKELGWSLPEEWNT